VSAGWLGVVTSIAMLACGGKSDSREPAPTNEVAGPVALRVVDQIGSPVPNTAVLIDGALVTTDADGQATSADVHHSYDAAVVVGIHAYAFLGLTTREPVLKLRSSLVPDFSSRATVEVLAGLPETTPVALIPRVTGTPPDEQAAIPRLANNDEVVEMAWRGSSNATLSLEAVVVQDGTDLNTVAFSSYATATLDAAPGAGLVWQPEFLPVPFDTVPIHVDTDTGGAELLLITCSATIDASVGPFGLLASVFEAVSADVPVLDIPGARYVMSADVEVLPDNAADDETMFHVEQRDVEAGSSVHLQAVPLAQNVAPKDGATIGPDTTFSWTAGEGAVNVLFLEDTSVEASSPLDDSATTPFLYHIATSELSARMPDLNALGVAFSAGDEFEWSVSSQFGHASVDTYAAGEPSNGYASTFFRIATAMP
jgi:hypothetical protein